MSWLTAYLLYCAGVYVLRVVRILLTKASMIYHWLCTGRLMALQLYDSLIPKRGPCRSEGVSDDFTYLIAEMIMYQGF